MTTGDYTEKIKLLNEARVKLAGMGVDRHIERMLKSNATRTEFALRLQGALHDLTSLRFVTMSLLEAAVGAVDQHATGGAHLDAAMVELHEHARCTAQLIADRICADAPGYRE